MTPVPQPKINSLIEQQGALIAQFTTTFQLDTVACKRLENEFTELAKLPKYEIDSYIALATISALRRRYDDTLLYFSKVRQLGAWDESTSISFAVCSLYCGDVLAAANEIQDLPIEGNPDYLRQLRAVCARVGLFNRAVQCTAKLETLGMACYDDAHDTLLSQEAAIAAEVVAYSDIDPQEVIERIHVAHTVVAQHSRDPFVVYGMSATFEGGTLYEFPLKVSRDELVELEWKIAEALVDNIENFTPGVISFGCATAPAKNTSKKREI